MIAPRLLTLTLMLCQVALAQGLVRFPSTSADLRHPYTLWLRNESETPRIAVSIHARLYPVTRNLGKEAEARLVFAPRTPAIINLPRSSRDVRLPFRLETDAPRGVYALEPNLPGSPVYENPPGYMPVVDYPLVYVPGLHVPRVYHTGQRFLYLGGAPRGYRHRLLPLRHRQVYGRVFTLTSYGTSYGGNRARFLVEGIGRVTLRSVSRTDFPGLAPILEDSSLASVRHTYVGKRVWQYGGPNVPCELKPGAYLTFGGPPRKSLRVRRVLRVARPSDLSLAGGFGRGGYYASNPGDLMSATPLVVQFEKPVGLKMWSASGGADLPRVTNRPDAELLRRCPPITVLYADAWQLPRTFSLTPPPPGLNARPLSQRIGLTRLQYAWLEGFPSATFGTKERLLELNTWKYDNIPFPITVTFRGGRVVKQDVPRLP